MTDSNAEDGASRWTRLFDVNPEEITSGSLRRVLPLLAVPLVVQNLVRVVQLFVDLFWLGRLDGSALSAVGIAFPAYSLLLAVVIYTPFVGTQILVSRHVGADDASKARRIALAGVAIALAFGVAVGGTVAATANSLIGLFVELQPQSTPAVVSRLAAAYLEVVAVGIVAAAVSDVVEAAFVGWGDSRAALYINVTSAAGNVVFDPILIFGAGPIPGFGVPGAAAATVCGYVAGLAVAVALLRNRDHTVLGTDIGAVSAEDVTEVLRVGIPLAVQRVLRPLGDLLLMSVVFAIGGAAGLAAYVVGDRVATIAAVPAQGLKQAAQSVVGQNLGADQPERADRAIWLGVAMISTGLLAVAALQWYSPGVILDVLAPELRGTARRLAVEFLRIYAYGYPALGATTLFVGGFNGADRTRTSLVGSLLTQWGLLIPAAAVGGLVLDHGVVAVFWAVSASKIVGVLGFGTYYRYATNRGMLDASAARASSR